MPGARCARRRACRGSGRAHTRSQVTPESPGIPRAMVYGLYVLSPVIGLLTPSLAKNFASLTPASRRQDHTTSPSASVSFVKDTFASTASRSNVRDDRETPLCVGRDAMYIAVIWVFGKPEYFFSRGWTTMH